MKKYILIIISLFVFNYLIAGVISPNLRYVQTDKEIWELDPTDFDRIIEENEIPDMDFGNLSVCIEFNTKINFTNLKLYINNKEIEDLSIMGSYSQIKNIYMLNIKNFIIDGKNTIEVYYRDSEGDQEEKKWCFNVGTAIVSKLSEPFQLTEGEGWKRMFSLSPDGRFVAYVLEGDLNAIKLYDLENKKEQIVISSKKPQEKFGEKSRNDKFYSFAPCWSRDGSYLFFISTKTGFFELYRAKISFNGEVSNIIQLTDYKAYTTSPVISPIDDKLFFISNKDGIMRLYYTENAEVLQGKNQFMGSVKSFTKENITAFSPSISSNGKYIAYCKQESDIGDIKVTIVIKSIKKRYLISEIEFPKKDCLYPSWSPENTIVSFYSGNSIYIKDVISESNIVKVASNCRMPPYVLKPFWYGKAIYFVSDDTNQSLKKVVINFKDFDKSYVVDLLNDRHYRDNMEIGVTNNLKYIIYNSFVTGTWQLWAISQNLGDDRTLAEFILPSQTKIKYFDRKDEKYKLIGYAPFLANKNAVLEKENMLVGFHRFTIDKKNKQVYTNPNKAVKLTLDRKKKSSINLSKGLYSTFIPGLGQGKSYQKHKGNYFFFSLLGLASLGAGSYYLQNQYYDKYNDSDNLIDIDENRRQYCIYSSLTNGFLIGGSLIYALNVFDALFSKPNIPKSDKKRLTETYRNIKSSIPQKRQMYGEKNTGTGELKIFSSTPYTQIKLRNSKTMEEAFYGTTGYTTDENTYFTIKNITPGNYTLICEKNFMKPYKEQVKIDEFKVNYSIVKMETNAKLQFKKFVLYSIPGYSQIKRREYIKGYTIAGLCVGTLGGVLISQLAAQNAYNDYNNANNINSIFETKSEYYSNMSYRNSFLVMFGLCFLYNLYDAYTGEGL